MTLLDCRRRPSSAIASLLVVALVVAFFPIAAPPGVAMAQPLAAFGNAVTVETGPFTTRIVTGDLTGDGYDDAVITLVEPDVEEGLQVLLNDGVGGLEAQDPIVFVNDPDPPHLEGMAIADFTGNGINDLAVVLNVDSQIAIFVNDGDGNLTPGPTFATTDRATSIVAEDLNGDGRADIAAISDRHGIVAIHLQNAGGGFPLSFTTVDLGVGNGYDPDPAAIAAGDVNGDGHVDLAVSHARARNGNGDRDGRVDVLRNNGNGQFTVQTIMLTSGNANPLLGPLALGDFDGNGRDDIVVTAEDNTRLLRAGADGMFGAAPVVLGTGPTTDVAVADFDLDNNLDFVVTNLIEPPDVGTELDDQTATVYVNPAGDGMFASGPVLDTGIEAPELVFSALGIAYWPAPDSVVTEAPFLTKPHVLVTHPEYALFPVEPVGEIEIAQIADGEGAVSLFLNESLDVVAPVSTLHVDPPVADGRNGWYVTKPTIDFTIDEPGTVYWTFDPMAGPQDFHSHTMMPAEIPGAGEHTLRWFAVDLSGNEESPIRSHVLRYDPALGMPPDADRTAGSTRYLTAIDVSMNAFDSADAVVLATGEQFPDALAGSGLAGTVNGPLLLNPRAALLPAVLAEINRLEATQVYLLGGTNALAPAVRTALENEGKTVTRLEGPDRYATAARIAEEMRVLQGGAWQGTAFIARGDDFADALSASPFATNAKLPILLVRPGDVPPATASAITALPITSAVITGGQIAVSPAVETALGTLGVTTSREFGNNRYLTALEIADRGVAEGWGAWSTVGVATGVNFPDGLAGGVAVGAKGGVLLLVEANAVPAAVASKLVMEEPNIIELIVFGGPTAISDTVLNQLKTLVGAGMTFITELVAADGVVTNASGRFMLKIAGDKAYYTLEVADLEDITMSHIHVAPAAFGVGPPAVWLFPSEPPATLVPGAFTGVLAQGTFDASDLIGPLDGMTLSALVTAINANRAYAHVHTVANPGGEISGFLVAK